MGDINAIQVMLSRKDWNTTTMYELNKKDWEEYKKSVEGA
jgi:hypothetical protein